MSGVGQSKEPEEPQTCTGGNSRITQRDMHLYQRLAVVVEALYIINSKGIAYHPSENEYISLSGEYIIIAKEDTAYGR